MMMIKGIVSLPSTELGGILMQLSCSYAGYIAT